MDNDEVQLAFKTFTFNGKIVYVSNDKINTHFVVDQKFELYHALRNIEDVSKLKVITFSTLTEMRSCLEKEYLVLI
jgi:hypothetical protein